MGFCTNCGTQNQDNAPSCANCGAPLAPAASTPVANYAQPAEQPGKGFAITSLVCGIVSFFCFGIILGILAVIFGAVAKSKGYTGGMATAGIVLGVIGLAIYVIMIMACGSAFMSIPFMDI